MGRGLISELLLLLCSLQLSVAPTLSSDVSALASLFFETSPTPTSWIKRLGWDDPSSTDPCDLPWTGVSCTGSAEGDADRRVTGVSLPWNNLTTSAGGLPLSLMNLTALTTLDLSLNHLKGLFPEVLWASLLRVQQLDLSGNQLTGDLYPSNLSDMVALVKLDLSSNNFTGFVPPDLRHMTSLQSLNLQSNALLGGPFPTLPSSVKSCHLAGIHFQCPLPCTPAADLCSASCGAAVPASGNGQQHSDVRIN